MGRRKKMDISVAINIVIACLTLAVIIIMSIYNQNLLDLTKESAEKTRESLNETKKLVNWTKPEPSIKLWSNVNLLGKNGTINLEISHYSPDKGVKDGIMVRPKTFELMVFNAGKGPLAFATVYLELTTNKTVNIFPFKLFKVSTILDILYYNMEERELKQSYESDYPISTKIELPYWHGNEKGNNGFPPSFVNNKIAYTTLLQTYSSIYAKINWSKQMGTYQLGTFGPFRLGNIEAGETKIISIELFGAVEDYNKELDSDMNYWTQQKLYADGEIKIIIKSENYNPIEQKFPIKSYFNIPD